MIELNDFSEIENNALILIKVNYKLIKKMDVSEIVLLDYMMKETELAGKNIKINLVDMKGVMIY